MFFLNISLTDVMSKNSLNKIQKYKKQKQAHLLIDYKLLICEW